MDLELKKEIDELKTELKLIKHLLEKKSQELPIELKTLTAKQVMEVLHINKDTLIKWRNKGEIKYKRLGNGNYIYPAIQFLNKEN